MTYVVIDQKGKVKQLNSDSQAEIYMKKKEGIYYLIEIFSDSIGIVKVKVVEENGEKEIYAIESKTI